MNRTVTIDELAGTVAQFTKCDAAEALAFVREAFMLAVETLSEGDSVDIKHLGTFAAVDGKLRFRPDPQLAAEINAPFAAFSAVEVTDPSLLEMQSEPDVASEPEVAIEESADAAKEIVTEIPDLETPEPEASDASEPCSEIEPEPEDEPAAPSIEPHNAVATQKSGKSDWLMPMLLAVLCLTVGFVMGRLTAPARVVTVDLQNTVVESEGPATVVDTVMPELAAKPTPADTSVAVVVSEPQATDIIVTDTIRQGRFLTTMARRHYGQMEYWVYIYKENSDHLGNPDHIEPGTVVVIPPAKKYGLVAGDTDKINEAKRLAAEIYKNH